MSTVPLVGSDVSPRACVYQHLPEQRWACPAFRASWALLVLRGQPGLLGAGGGLQGTPRTAGCPAPVACTVALRVSSKQRGCRLSLVWFCVVAFGGSQSRRPPEASIRVPVRTAPRG